MKKNLKSNLEIKKLIDITIKWILKTKSHLDSEKIKRPKQNGYKDDLDIWNKIAFEYFGKIEYKNALNIFSWWKRNTHKFATIVKSKISKFDDSFMEVEKLAEQEIVLDLDQKDLEVIKKFIRFYEPRSKFNTDFANFLSERLQNFGIKCWLRTTGNAFKKKLSQKKSSPFWRGTFKCIDFNCSNKFKAVIRDDLVYNFSLFESERNLANSIKVTVKEEYFHDNFLKAKIRSAGIERTNQSINVLAHGILNVSINNRINNDENTSFLDQKVTNRFTLAMCKSSLVNFYKISNNAFVDALATKNVCDQLLSENEFGMNGYIQEISLSPFGYLLFSKIQINMWIQIRKENAVWFFDATGNVQKEIVNQKKPFLYSVIMHDVSKKKIIPFADFITTAHDQITISKYLLSIKYKIKPDLYPEIIVTDFSWALINSVSNVFNFCDIKTYLIYVFQNIVHQERLSPQIKVKPYLCSTHILKMIIKRAKKINVESYIRNSFIFMFTLIQNCTSLIEIENNLINIYNVFNNPKYDFSTHYSLCTLRDNIQKRGLTNIDISGARDAINTIRDLDFDKLTADSLENESEKVKTIKQSSPFTSYFDTMFEKYEKKINTSKSEQDINNEYFCPDLFKVLKDILYLLPLWSGILIGCCTIGSEIKSRISNNPVENWFSQVKNGMHLNKKVTSIITSVCYKRLSMNYKKNYDKNHIYESDLFEKKPEEKWSKINKNVKKKNYYFKNFDIIRLNHNFRSHESNIFRDSFKTKQDKSNQEPSKKVSENQKKSKTDQQETKQINENESDCVNSFLTFLNDDFKVFIESNVFEEIRSVYFGLEEFFEKYIFELRSKSYESIYSNQIVYKNFKKDLGLDENMYPVYSKPDGNCLYNSISIILFGYEDKFFIIKSCSIFILLKYQNFFENLMKLYNYEYSFEELVSNTSKRSEWGCELNILSISIMLDTTIYCYNKKTKKTKKNRINYSVKSRSSKNKLNIGICDNHFFPILTKKDRGNQVEKISNEIEFLSKDLINQFEDLDQI